MNTDIFSTTENGIIATIENADNPSQVVAVKYSPEENAFVTSGIEKYFGEKEILMPAHLMVMDFQLMGTIISAILENLSHAHENEQPFEYASKFEVLGNKYKLEDQGAHMKLSVEEDPAFEDMIRQ